jgi:hypothetical protein
MEKKRLEKFVGKLVRVDLSGGQQLHGTLGTPPLPGMFELLNQTAKGNEHTIFWPVDVEDIMLLHLAEAAAMERDCTCDENDLMSWTACPLHRFEGQ